MGTRRTAAVVVACLAGLLTACGPDDGADDNRAEPEPSLELPTEPVFEPGPRRFPTPAEDRVWAEGSVLHLGEQTYDLAPTVVDGFLPTPYGVFVRHVEGSGIDSTYEYGFYDGSGPLQDLPSTVHDLAVSESGEYVGWISDDGPEVESHAEDARSGVAVLLETATGRVLHQTTDALLEGADYPDEYTPKSYGFIGETYYWGDAYSGEAAALDATTLETELLGEDVVRPKFEGARPGGYDVGSHYEELEYGAVRITDSHGRRVDIGYEWAIPLGTVGEPASDRVLLLGQHVSPGDLSDASAPQDGAIVECALGSGDCTEVAMVAAADDVRGAYPLLW